ncbi:MAG: hypothetical protein Q8P49_04235 [Candidatus Liptonbacteria bacterium]|nr:hypothetical protein [Candidatus Liptonbacteria bacterium]
MFQFILTNILLVSVGAILYVSVRTLPRIEESGAVEKKGILDRWIASEIPERIDVALNNFLFKFLKKLRVALLKADNSVGERLKKIKPENGAGAKASNIDFKEISGQNKEEIPS